MKKKIENNKKLILLLVTLLIFAFSISANAASWPSFGSSKPIRAYTISSRNNTTAYSDANLKKKRGTIYASDEIYIYSIGSNASSTMVAYCSYPVPGGRKYAFIPLQAVTNVRYPGELNTARSSVITYRRPGSSTRAGSISKNDKVYKLSVSGSYTQVLYNIGSASNPTGWRMAWITTSNYNNYIKQAYNPQGYLDAVSSNATGKITVSGWAFDRDSLSSSLQIHVYVGGPAGSGAPGYSITANQRRTDVNNAYLGVGNYHGFSNTISVSRTGTQTVYVYAINVGGGQNVLLGSKTITIQDTNSTLRISGQASPGTMYQGAGFTIRGTISSNYKITKVKCGIYTSSGATVSEKTVYPNSYSYNVNSIDSYIHFSYAKPGTNYYRVWATDAKGTKLLQNTSFKVVSGNTTSEKRKKVVNYMRAMATVKWTPQTTFKHWSGKRDWCAGTIYYGIPYSQNCRVTTYERFISNLRGNKYIGPSTPSTYLGSDCSSAVSIAWQQADSSFSIRNTYSLQPDNPKISMVGNYSYSAAYCSNTRKICSNNGTSKMYSAYKNLQPGDAVVNRISSNGGHAMLVTSVSSNSIKVIEQTEYDPGLHSTWRVDKQYSFSELYAQGYLPVRLSTM